MAGDDRIRVLIGSSDSEFLAELLDACPPLRLLITSRVVLGIVGEHVADIRPFPLPPLEARGSAPDPMYLEAIQLFADRARVPIVVLLLVPRLR